MKDSRLSLVLQEVELLGCETVLLGEWFSFLEVLYSFIFTVKQSMENDCFTLRMKAL